MNFPWADHSEWSEFQNLPTSNFVHCSLEWATLEICYFRLFCDLVNCFSIWPEFLNLAHPNFSIRTFTGRAKHFAWSDRARRTIGYYWKIKLANPLFLFRHVLRTFAAFKCFSLRIHCVTPVDFCDLPLCREDRKILLIPIGYDKA